MLENTEWTIKRDNSDQLAT